MKRLTITVKGNWTCNDGRGWIARRITESHVVINSVMAGAWTKAISAPCLYFLSPRTYGPAPCPPVEIVLAEEIGFGSMEITNQRDYARAARNFIKANIDRIPYESPVD